MLVRRQKWRYWRINCDDELGGGSKKGEKQDRVEGGGGGGDGKRKVK